MALGSVSISTFIPEELEDLTGTVSIIPFTRAEIERLANKKAYPNGKVVWSQGINASGSITVPEEVDYITLGTGIKRTQSPEATARVGSRSSPAAANTTGPSSPTPSGLTKTARSVPRGRAHSLPAPSVSPAAAPIRLPATTTTNDE